MELTDSRWKDIYNHLKENNYDVYSPAQHQGQCLKDYVVIATAESSRFLDYSSQIVYYDLMLYVPQNSYSELEVKFKKLKEVMKELETKLLIRYSENDTAPYYDDSVKGYMVSTQYLIYKKI